MEQTECSETSAYKIQTLGNSPEKKGINNSEQGESLKLSKRNLSPHSDWQIGIAVTGIAPRRT